MVNMNSICDLCQQISKTAERVEQIGRGLEYSESSRTVELYEDMMLSEMENLQRSILALTGLVAESLSNDASNADGEGSVFAEGDLDFKEGEKTSETGTAEEEAEEAEK